MGYYKDIKPEYYDFKKALSNECDRYIIFGERQAGKTTSVFGNLIEEVVNSNYERQFAYCRRWFEDIKGGAGELVFDNLLPHDLNWVEEITKGKFNTIVYRGQKWFFANTLKNGGLADKQKDPFCLGFAIRKVQNYRGGQYPRIDSIFWDEFLAIDNRYLPHEYDLFKDIISSIKRRRTNVKIIMCANTVDREAQIWHDLGYYGIIKYMIPGESRIMEGKFGDATIKTYLEFTKPPKNSDEYNKMYADKSRYSDMIVNGEWVTGDYPILPEEPDLYRPKHIKYTFFIKVYDEFFEGNIITRTDKKHHYMYIHKPVSMPEKLDKYLVFSTDYDLRYNYRRDILKPVDDITKMIASFFKTDNVFYDSNTTGSMIDTFLNLFN